MHMHAHTHIPLLRPPQRRPLPRSMHCAPSSPERVFMRANLVHETAVSVEPTLVRLEYAVDAHDPVLARERLLNEPAS